MQVPVGPFDLMAIRRRPLADISNVKSENLRFKMMETEKKIAESMFSEAFKEKEVIRLQSIKTVDLLKIELKKSEEALATALNKMSSQCDAIGVDSILNQRKIDGLMEEILNLRTELAVATATIVQQKVKLEENDTLRASIANATATIAQQQAKLEENEILRASIAEATATIAVQQAQIEENELLRASIADATATILEQKAKLEENEILRNTIADAKATIAQQEAKLVENELLRASIADATITISEQGAKIEENELLRASIADATVTIAQQQLNLMENEMLRATIAHATATIALQEAKLEENDALRISIAEATATIAKQQAKINENELLRASIAEATLTIAEQKARLAENELITVSIEEDVVELQSKSSLLASALTIAYDTISKQEKEIEVSTQEKVLHSEELVNLLDENAQLKNKVEVLASAADEHEPIVASMHREKEEFASRVYYLEKQLIDLTELHDLEKADAIVVPDELQISMNLISEISEDLHLDNVQEVTALNSCVATLQWQNSKLIVENQGLSDSKNTIQENFSQRIKLLKQKLGWKTRILTLANALQRTHHINLEEVTGTMSFEIQMLTHRLMETKKTLGEKVNELTVLRVDDNRKNNELQALIEQLEESHDHSLVSRAEIVTLQRERSLLEAECSARTAAMTILEEECNARNTTITLLEEECNSRNNTICGLEEECSFMSESKCATEKEIDEVAGRFVRMNEEIMTRLEEQAEEHSTSESRLENLLWNTKEEHLIYMKLVKNLNNKILEKEFEITRLLKNESTLNDQLNTDSALITVLESKKARLSEDKKELKAQLIEAEIASNLRNKEIMDEYLVVCDTLTKRNTQNATLENDITENIREIDELKNTVFQLEVQLVSGGELVATLESQVVLEKNLTEERTLPLLDQMMTIQRAHRAQRDEDTTLIESLESKCQIWRSENNQLVANLAKSVAETGLLAETEKDQMKMILENNTKISFLAESLKLLEEHTTMKNQDIAELNRMVGCLNTAFEQANQSLELKGTEATQLILKLEVLENEETKLLTEIRVKESTITEMNAQLIAASSELNEFRCEFNMNADLLASCELREIALMENEKVLKGKIVGLEDDMRNMGSKVEMRDEDILNLLTKVDTAHKDVCRLDNKARQLIVEKQSFESTIEKKEEEISALTKELESLGSLMKGSENVLDTQMNLLSQSEEKLKSTIESLLHSEMAKVEKQEHEMKQNESFNALLENTKIESNQLNSEIKSLTCDLQNKEKRINELEIIRLNDQEELTSMRAKRVKYEEKIDSLIELASMMEASSNTNNSCEMTLSNLKAEKNQCETHITTLTDHIATLSASLITAQDKTENLATEVLTLTDKIGNLSTLLDNKDSEIGLLSQRLQQGAEHTQTLQDSLLQAEQRVECLSAGATDPQTCLDELKNALALSEDRAESLSQALLISDSSADSLTTAIQERDLQIISLNNSLEESVEMCAELTETEMRLQSELNTQIAASTEEIEALSCTHSESIKVLEESVQRLTAHTEELQKKVFFEQQRWALEGVYDCENYEYSTESKSSGDDEEVQEVVMVVEGEVNLESGSENDGDVEGVAWVGRSDNSSDRDERSPEGRDFNFNDISGAGAENSFHGSSSGQNNFENTNEMFKTVKPEIRIESREMRNGNCRLNDSYGSVAERFFEFGNPLLSQKMGNKKRDSLPKLVDRNFTDSADTVFSPAPVSKLQSNWRLAKELKRAKASRDETDTACTIANMPEREHLITAGSLEKLTVSQRISQYEKKSKYSRNEIQIDGMEQMFSPKVKLFNSPPVTPKKQLSVNFALDTIFKDSDFENDENRENIRSIENREIDTWEGEDVDRQMDREFFEQTFGPSPRPKHYPSKHRPVDLGDVCTSHLTPERTSNPTDIDCELRARLQAIEIERLRLLSPDFKSSNQPKLQLTNRLDELQHELNKKNDESNSLQLMLSGVSQNMEKKIEENKDLLLKLSSLEERNMKLELELSVFRASQRVLNTENRSVNIITPINISSSCDFTYI